MLGQDINAQNNAVKARQEAKQCADNAAMADKNQQPGRFDTPVIKRPSFNVNVNCSTPEQACLTNVQALYSVFQAAMQIADNTGGMGQNLLFGALRQMLIPTWDIRSLLITTQTSSSGNNPYVVVIPISSSGTTVAACTYTVPEGFIAIIEKFGVGVWPNNAAQDITWQILVNGEIQPGLSTSSILMNTLATPLDFKVYLTPGQKLELRAINNGVNPVNVSGLLTGFLRPVKA